MMWAYGVPFHITQGAPPLGLPGSAASEDGVGAITMMCGPARTQSLGGALSCANGSLMLAPRSPWSMYATPTPESFGVFLVTQASAHFWNSGSRHIGSSPTAPLAAGVVGKHTQPFVPARNWVGLPPSVAGQSIIVAALAMESGAALIAFLILSSLPTRSDRSVLRRCSGGSCRRGDGCVASGSRSLVAREQTGERNDQCDR